MKSFKIMRESYAEKKEEIIQTILKMWGQAIDVEDIVTRTGKPVSFIKNVLKKAGKRGWEEL